MNVLPLVQVVLKLDKQQFSSMFELQPAKLNHIVLSFTFPR